MLIVFHSSVSRCDAAWGHPAAALLITAVVAAGLLLRLRQFPGLHGDEAWVGLRALEQQAHGMFTIRGMNGYTGSLFPELVAMSFSLLQGADVASLRLPGAVLNGLSLLVMAIALGRPAAAWFAMLMGSSLLFLFYSRVAWEVNALQNLILGLVLLSLTRLLRQATSSPGATFVLLLAFSTGCWNHAIFAAAAVAFTAAAGLVALRWPSDGSARLLMLGGSNLLLQSGLLLGRRLIADGPFASHALPALAGGIGLIALAARAHVRAEPRLVPLLARTLAHLHSAFPAPWLVPGFAVLAVVASPANDVAFVGTVSGVIMLERVASYLPGPLETAALHIRMAILLGIFVSALWATCILGQSRDQGLPRDRLLLVLLLLWTLGYFPVLRLIAPGVADRYCIIPQFLFFAVIALAVDMHLALWRRAIAAVLILGFVYAQLVLARETTRDSDRPPLETFRYAEYADTSRHFLRLDALVAHLQSRAVCRVESSSFFIVQPLRFMLASGNPCSSAAAVQVEYCTACDGPVPWFGFQPLQQGLRVP